MRGTSGTGVHLAAASSIFTSPPFKQPNSIALESRQLSGAQVDTN
jgi:hypothetical protein